MILSIATADPSTPAPTYGSPASSSSPCTVPSSPYGPWRRGNTTSTARGVGAPPVLWVTDASLPGDDGGSTGDPATSKAAGNASRPASSCATASSANNHRP